MREKRLELVTKKEGNRLEMVTSKREKETKNRLKLATKERNQTENSDSSRGTKLEIVTNKGKNIGTGEREKKDWNWRPT